MYIWFHFDSKRRVGWGGPTIQVVLFHCPFVTMDHPHQAGKQVWVSHKNCLKGCDWVLSYHILHFTLLSINKISLHYHKKNLTKAYLASAIITNENQLLNQFSYNFAGFWQGAPNKPAQRGWAISFAG